MPTEKKIPENFINTGGYLRVPKTMTQRWGSPLHWDEPEASVKQVGENEIHLVYKFKLDNLNDSKENGE